MNPQKGPLKIRRALLSVSNKTGLVELATALAQSGSELVATGNTARVLEAAGLKITPIEKVSGSPEAFQGRMKTLSYPICSGILYRRGDAGDEADLKRLGILPIDCVVVNFYPFEHTVAELKTKGQESTELTHALIENIDIGGPTLVRAAAKNSPDVLVLVDPTQYEKVIADLNAQAHVSPDYVRECARLAWERISEYDLAIARELGHRHVKLKYGENPHQTATLKMDHRSPVQWAPLAAGEVLSYNNILDVTAAYRLATDLKRLAPDSASVVIVKHNNPCGVATIPGSHKGTLGERQLFALERAWEGDPVSAFGGVLVFTDPLQKETAEWLSGRFIEVIASPGLTQGDAVLQALLVKRKNLRAVAILRFESETLSLETSITGGSLSQDPDANFGEELRSVTKKIWPKDRENLARFGIAVCRSLKSNAIAIVRQCPDVKDAYQLVGAGQGQPNRVEALKWLAVPRARAVLGVTGGEISECVMVSDAFFPFRDTVDESHQAGIRWIIQPGGSIKDVESIHACDEHGIAMAFTGKRHFRH